MMAATSSLEPGGLVRLLSWRRVLFTLAISAFLGLLLTIPSISPARVVVTRAVVVGLITMLTFGLLERWPSRLPAWLARWALQLIGVVVVVPFAAWVAYWLTTGGAPQLGQMQARLFGYLQLTFAGVLVAPWIALGAMVRQRDAFARSQAVAFKLERSELERKASDARLRLLQAQVEPHFLFNTLANVRALVDTGSPKASAVLGSLIDYLRAAVPRLHDPTTTLGQELQLVRSYLELMYLRMPDRLQFVVQADEAASALRCPPMTLLPLVENAVRHGIDPSEDGGRIEVSVNLRGDRCHLTVSDTGVGLQAAGDGLGTGLSTLRERLQLAFGGDAQLRISELVPHGVHAEIEFPAQSATA